MRISFFLCLCAHLIPIAIGTNQGRPDYEFVNYTGLVLFSAVYLGLSLQKFKKRINKNAKNNNFFIIVVVYVFLSKRITYFLNKYKE